MRPLKFQALKKPRECQKLQVDDVIEQIYNKPKFCMKPGMQRIKDAYNELGRPLSNTPTILVGGTNGKGTTSAMLYQLIAEQGYKVVLFTSPHLKNYSERFLSSHFKIQDEFLVKKIKEMKNLLKPTIFEKMSFFEITTALALFVFEQLKPEVAILEVGLGGRLDCTNIVDPIASVITSIGIDHTQQLGNTIEQITSEKLGICRTTAPLFIGNLGDQALAKVLASKKYKTLLQPEESQREQSQPKEPPSEGQLHHSYLCDNYHLANQVFGWLSQHKLRPLPTTNIRPDYNLPHASGRFDLRSAGNKKIQVLLDVCHNPNGAKTFVESFRKEYGDLKVPGLISIFADKDIKNILDHLNLIMDPLIFFSGSSPRCWHQDDLPKEYANQPFFQSFDQAWQHLSTHYSVPTNPQPVAAALCGSVHMVGDAMEQLNLDTEIDLLTKVKLHRNSEKANYAK